MAFLILLIQSTVADWMLKQLVIIYSIAPILQIKDLSSWSLFQQ